MQPFNTGGAGAGGSGSVHSRTEAERWFGIAEKLLSGRDLIGAKTFAIRARESDPRFEAADLILTIVDTLIAGEKRINGHPDWYGIFQLPPLCSDMDLIANQYRHLALLLNPHKNRLPFADEASTLISYAWSVLSDPSKKFRYDNDLNLFTRFDPAPSHRQEIDLRFVQSPMPQQPPPLPPLFSPVQPQQPPPPPPQPLPTQPQPLPTQPQQQQQFPSQPQQQNVDIGNEARSMEEEKGNASEESEKEDSGDENSPFWTACPYCYCMFEYPGMYKGCTFRCQNCRRAFHGEKIASPPVPVDGNQTQFCCWGFIPLAGSLLNSNNKKWTPFSQMISYRTDDVNSRAPPRQNSVPKVHVVDDNANANANANANVNANANAKANDDDDDDDDDEIFIDDSSSDDSDADWDTTNTDSSRKRKASYATKGKGPMKRGDPHSKPVSGPNGVSTAGSSFMAAAAIKLNLKKNQGKVPKEWGKLDLNVEFSKEEEEQTASGIRLGGGGRAEAVHAEEEEEEHEGIEGISFFEGLDEFLSSLPILNEEDKVKSG